MISRAEWRDILQRIKKGGVEELKSYSTNVAKGAYQEAFAKGVEAGMQKGYEQGIEAGVEATRTSIMGVVEAALHKEFTFGKKRLQQFNDAFLKEVQLMTQKNEEKEEESKEQSTQQMIMTEEDQQRYMVFHCMSEFLLQSLKSKDTYMFNSEKSKHQLETARDSVEFLLHSMRDRVSPEEHDKLMEELKEMSLYLAPTRVEEKSVS